MNTIKQAKVNVQDRVSFFMDNQPAAHINRSPPADKKPVTSSHQHSQPQHKPVSLVVLYSSCTSVQLYRSPVVPQSSCTAVQLYGIPFVSVTRPLSHQHISVRPCNILVAHSGSYFINLVERVNSS